MKKIIKYLSISLGLILTILSCEVTDFELQEDPNFLSPESANPESLLNELQFLFQDIVSDMIRNTDDIMRYEAMTNNYADVANATSVDTEWERFYEALLISRTIEQQATNDSNLLLHNAISKLLMGYLTTTMVDYIGSIPFTEAANAIEFPNPNLDSGTDLYRQVLADIDQAIIDINNSTFDVSSDLFYDSDRDKWVAFANSFKLRLLIQAQMASTDIGVTNLNTEINNLLNNDLIDTPEEDFVWRNAAVVTPESRHKYFTRGYLSGFSQYIGNQFMFMLKDSKSNEDPRIRYYLYRQSNIDPFSPQLFIACGEDPGGTDFCYIGDGYWGLDHGETRTGRGDDDLRTTFGIYPGGGKFDEDDFSRASGASSANNLNGAGIIPILTSFNLKFLIAESALTLGTDGDPSVLLEEGIRGSMGKVLSFGGVSSSFAATSTDVDNYIFEVLADYSSAASLEERMDILITEAYLANFGNSIEAYNAYRRTGYPSNLQIPIDDDNPTFPRSFPYSNDAVNTNLSLDQKQITEQVFWDKNPQGFIN